VFDEFIAKTKYIAPLVEKRFSSIKQIYEEYDRSKYAIEKNKLDPVSAYLEHENISYDQLVEFLKSIGQRAKKPFRKALAEVGSTILGKEPEYYDDYYFFSNRIYSDIDRNFSSIDPVTEARRILRLMEFDLSKIHFDTEDRRNKYPSPICFPVRIPNDIRILYKSESAYLDFEACFHETGHAMHGISIDVENEYWDKYRIPMGVAEVFSTFLERLTKNSNYIMPLVSSDKHDNLIHKMTSRNYFIELFFITFYTANSLMKLEYWKKNLSIEQASEFYSKLIEEYMGFDMPGQYWLLHHILPESIMHVPSYLLAAVRAAELDNYMKNRFGVRWWTEKESGRTLREIMEPGASIDLSIFSKLDNAIYMKEVLEQI
jgi:Peptidase family M3